MPQAPESISGPARELAGTSEHAVILVILCASLTASCIGAGTYPEPLSNRHEIQAASPKLDSIDIWNLPLQDYPLLSRFTRLKRIRLYSREGTFATDDKLKAIATLRLTNLTQVEVIDLIVTMRKGIWCHVVDRAGRLDQETLRAKAAERGSRVLVRSTGALQDMRLRQ